MGELFFLLFNIFGLVWTVVQLFLPIFLKTSAYYDMNRRKLTFVVYLFGFLRVFGGYIATYKGGFAIHVSEKKAFLIPYSKLNSERKRFSFMRTFHLSSITVTTETGAEYLLPIALAQAILRVYFLIKGGKKEKIKNNLWLTNGDVLRITATIVVRFNMFIILCNVIKFIKEKLQILWRTKIKKSTT